VAQSYFSYQFLETGSVGGASPGMTLVTINNHNSFERPAQGDGPLLKSILANGAFGVLKHLT